MTKKKRGRFGLERSKRFCVECGIQSGPGIIGMLEGPELLSRMSFTSFVGDVENSNWARTTVGAHGSAWRAQKRNRSLIRRRSECGKASDSWV